MVWKIADAIEQCALVRQRPALGRRWCYFAARAEKRGYDRAGAIRYAGVCIRRQSARERARRKAATWAAFNAGGQGALFDDSGEAPEIRRAGVAANDGPP